MKIEQSVDVDHQVGARIRFLRINSNQTIEELAFESGINTNYLSDLERGNRNPTIKVLNKIANGLKISLSELLLGIHEDL
jgi:transcriptional regulator with XRE-family HTH domain